MHSSTGQVSKAPWGHVHSELLIVLVSSSDLWKTNCPVWFKPNTLKPRRLARHRGCDFVLSDPLCSVENFRFLRLMSARLSEVS